MASLKTQICSFLLQMFKVVDPKRAIPREEMAPFFANQVPQFLEGEVPAEAKVLLSNIDWDHHTVDDLRHYFDTFGAVVQVEILGHPRGDGFVAFDGKTAAQRCLAATEHKVNGKKLDVAKVTLCFLVLVASTQINKQWTDSKQNPLNCTIHEQYEFYVEKLYHFRRKRKRFRPSRTKRRGMSRRR